MKKIYIILIGIFYISISGLWAQHIEEQAMVGEKYYAQKISFITDAMDLTPEEAAVFWPLYNESEKKRKELMSEANKYRKEVVRNFGELSEGEAKEALAFFQDHMTQMNDLTKEYQNKYLEVVSAKKVLKLMKAEKDFRRKMLKRLSERRQRNHNRP